MDRNIVSDDVIGYGIIDLDPYLNFLQVKDPELDNKDANSLSNGPSNPPPKQTKKQTTLRCFLNYDRKQAGIVQLLASFKEEKTTILSFRFETA